jgi:hypothetical protein
MTVGGRCLVALAIVLVSSVASAQPDSPSVAPPTVQLSPARKAPSTAILLSLGITTASYIAFAYAHGNQNLQLAALVGAYVGPSTGQWYAGEGGELGLGVRFVGCVSGLYGLSQVMSSSDSAKVRGIVLVWGGASLWVGSSIYDIVLAKRAADSWNARHNVSLAPMVARDASGSRTPGLVLTGRF